MNISAIKSALWHSGWRRRLAVSLALVLAIALSACSPDLFRTEAAQIPRLVISVTTDPKTFNYVLSEESPNVFEYIYDGLLSQNGVTGELEPALAESWEISDDNLQITFTLRQGLQWSDGEPLTADDVVFTYNSLYFNENIPTSIRDILRIGDTGALPEVRKVDDRRVAFIVPEPFAPLLRFSGGLAILPQHALNQYIISTGEDGNLRFLSTWGTDSDPRQVIGNGPYTLVSYSPSQRVIFERNPYYWRKDAAGNSLPYIQRFIWQIVESTDAALVQFRSGGLDTVGVTPANFSLLKREEERGNFEIQTGGPAFGTTFIAFNQNQGSRDGQPLVDPIKSRWFNSVEFRQAVAYALDRGTMINNIYRGIGEPQHSPISVQSPYYLSPEEGLRTYSYDTDRAKELLQSAGFRYNDAGQLLDADGNRVRFTLLAGAGSQTGEAIGVQVKRDLDAIGMQVDFLPIAFNTLIDKLDTTLDWDCVLISFTGGVEPNGGANFWQPDGRLHMFNLAAQASQSPIEGRVVQDWEAEIGRLYTQGAQELDEAARKEIYGRTQQIAQEYLPCIYMVNPLSMSAIRNRLKGVQYSALGGTLWNIYQLQLVD